MPSKKPPWHQKQKLRLYHNVTSRHCRTPPQSGNDVGASQAVSEKRGDAEKTIVTETVVQPVAPALQQHTPTAAVMDRTLPAVMMQRMLRVLSSATEVVRRQALLQEKAYSALKIECAFRQHNARSELTSRRRQRREQIEAQNTLLDAQVLAMQSQTKDRTEEETRRLRNRAAVKIQCAYRCYNARFYLRWKLAERNEKRRLAREKELGSSQTKAAVVIQCFFRKVKARRTVKSLKQQRQAERLAKKRLEDQMNAAALKIQCAYRCYNARFEAAWRLEDKKRREDRLLQKKRDEEQTLVKAVTDKNEGKELTKRKAREALRIECAWRCYNARFELRWRRERKQKRDEEAKQLAKRQQAHEVRTTRWPRIH